MKILRHTRQQGSVLMTGLIVSLAAGIALASYLLLISNRYRMTVRSADWNQAMPVLESGIEEALTHMHAEFTNLSLNGWIAGTLSGQPVFSKFRTNSDGSYFWTSIVTNGCFSNPIVYSSGFVPLPQGEGYISRTVKVTTARPLLFANAVAATGLIQFNGNSGFVDAYNSCDGPYGGTNSHGSTSLVTSSTASPAINTGNANIYGTLDTGADGTIATGPNSSVGDASWVSNHTGIQAGYTNDNMNASYPSNSPPTFSQTPLAPTTVTGLTNIMNAAGLTNLGTLTNLAGITSATMLTGGNYQVSSVSISSSSNPVLITAPSVLYVTGNINISSGDIEILPGASLTVYVAGNTTLSGQGVINDNGSPANFTYIGLAGNTSIAFSGSANFYGTIDAPEANFTMTGNAGVFGAVIVKTYTNSGNASFHYDQCLGFAGDLVVTSWQETF